MSSNKRENIGQIPKAGSIGEVQKAVSEQGEVHTSSTPSASSKPRISWRY